MTDTTRPERTAAPGTPRPDGSSATLAGGPPLPGDLPTFADLWAATAGGAPTDAQLTAHFAPVFAAIAAGAAQRELDHELAFAAIEALRASGFTRVRLAREHGGIGASLPQLAGLLVDLAAADSNLPQALHGHFMFTEQHQNESQGAVSEWWLAEVAAGRIFGNALVELPPAAGSRPVLWTDADPDTAQAASAVGSPEVAEITGDKFYSTGALFADHLLVTATRPGREDEGPVFAIVDAGHEGVRRIDDWNGFGQRLTASGTTTFDRVPVRAHRTQEFNVPTGVLAYPVLWVVLSATQAGIGAAALAAITDFVRARRRTYDHALAETPAEDPLVHQVIGAVSAKVSAARHVVTSAAAVVEESFRQVRGHRDLEDPVVLEAHARANVALSEASLVVSELVLEATNQVFECGGASATDAARQLHRHWLNARTIASHTPLVYRTRAVGDYRLNGTVPPFHSTARNSAPAGP
ncbi:acyl-CoA dehydrogenase [Citricoccus sp. SGAir0253]|uniref:acyl-CoA dehydrogenase n=1 Tax=Citricoccus sp. SGAir0253 TaxID=2567881 RepID=UPI0010CD545B|nr:acyl-CoA dehydrogenase [Citricoccus sp. SGAir0253]QCU78869.1 acyl-CoA dehydrogenase [Citricoccus sp. SGAir0253]